MLFLSFDTDRSGKMSSYELRTALKAAGERPPPLPEPGVAPALTPASAGVAGMQLNNSLLQLISLRFADRNYDIDFDDYLTCIVRLENMFSRLRAGGAKVGEVPSPPVGADAAVSASQGSLKPWTPARGAACA